MSLGYAKYTLEEWTQCMESFQQNKNLNIRQMQLYLPIYRLFFNMSETSSKYTTLNQHYRLLNVVKEEYTPDDEDYYKIGGLNRFKVKVWDNETSSKQVRNAFFKFSPLMDPAKYLVGKYQNLQERTLYDIYRLPRWYEGLRAEQPNEYKTSRKIDTPHNNSYVDSFFSYLTSMAKHSYNIQHGIDYYGSYLGIHPKFPYNAVDEIDYLNDSTYFHTYKSMVQRGGLDQHPDSLFEVESSMYDYIDDESRKYRKPLKIHSDTTVDTESFDNELFDGIFDDSPLSFDSSKNHTTRQPELLWNEDVCFKQNERSVKENDNDDNDDNENSRQENDNDSIESSDTDDEEEGSDVERSDDESDGSHSGSKSGSETESESGEENDDETESSSDESDKSDESESILGENEHVWIKIRDFPVDIICLESMDGTLDSLMEQDQLKTNEWVSCIAQVVLQLIAYQKMFHFTHNDLHTNNIMYTNTDRKYLFYKVKGVHYRVPTFGKLFKIIDFGRAIYTYRGVRICSDSYHRRGDAATQYNTEPYFDSTKPRIEPNPSFDLARLGCSLYDFFIGDIRREDENVAPLERMIIDWCRDDDGKNLLYFSNGDERYPGFKLYKMISRYCSKTQPMEQFTKQRVFKSLQISKKKIPKSASRHVMNLDTLPDLTVV